MSLAHGLKFQGTLDSYAMHLITCCDGQRRLGDLIAEMAPTVDMARASSGSRR